MKPYKPFSELKVGELFTLTDSDIMHIKVDDDTAVRLKGYSQAGVLYPRGGPRSITPTTCVISDKTNQIELSNAEEDPIDPRRKFWTEFDVHHVGRNNEAKINVFGGLFVYSWLGMGNYYAATNNEIFWCSVTEAKEKAKAEGVPFVCYDMMEWTSDPTLKRDREEAQKKFDKERSDGIQN